MFWFKSIGVVATAALCGLIVGCSSEGPLTRLISSDDITVPAYAAPEGSYSGGYFLIPLDKSASQLAGRRLPTTFQTAFGVSSVGSSNDVGVGDELKINIWEATNDGLFASTGGGSGYDSIVDDDGMVFVPFVGRIRVAGRSVEDARGSIQAALDGKAVEPQVLVNVMQPRANVIVVVGDVGVPGRYPISPAGTKVLELIAQAGGARSPSFETTVKLNRNGHTASALLEHVFEQRENNIELIAGDHLLLLHEPRSFSAFGAVPGTQIHNFQMPNLTLAEGVGLVGGLIDDRSDAGGIFLFRYEEVELVRELRPDVQINGYTHVPVVYQLSFKEPRGFFYARHFLMRDKDILYVANSLTSELAKFTRILQPLLGTASSAVSVADTQQTSGTVGSGVPARTITQSP